MTLDHAPTRLATYGTLSPGEENHHIVSMIEGQWSQGIVRGTRLSSGWGAAEGFPGFIPDPNGPEVSVWLLESADLPTHWARIDEFEGEGYERREVEVITNTGRVMAEIYCLAPP